MDEATWEDRVAKLWSGFDEESEEEFLLKLGRLIAELPPEDSRALFERACGHDSTGNSAAAVPLYRQALVAGLTGLRRRRAVIQLASSLRNVGQAEESVKLLTAERKMGSDELNDAVAAFLALSLAEVGQERKALSIALTALGPHLARYNRSLANYAADLAAE